MMKPNITPVGTFQRITSTAPLRAETREAIQNTVLQFYIQNSQPEDDAEGLTACYERLSQEDKLDGESNSIINQELLCRGWSHHLIHMTAVHLWRMVHCSYKKGGENAKTSVFRNCNSHFAANERK